MEMEVTKEIREVLFDNANHPQDSVIESLNGRRHDNSWDYVVFEECKDTNNQLFDFSSFFIIFTV
jgi:hypothetical protein